jgi:SWI/SNF-related matrix-associated actin-dependent regulator of chromatin subfamily A member 5
MAAADGPHAKEAVSLTSRQAIRSNIAAETEARRANFIISKKDYFLPLLPENNYVEKLVNRRRNGQLRKGNKYEEEGIYEYEAIDKQPEGWVSATRRFLSSSLSFPTPLPPTLPLSY